MRQVETLLRFPSGQHARPRPYSAGQSRAAKRVCRHFQRKRHVTAALHAAKRSGDSCQGMRSITVRVCTPTGTLNCFAQNVKHPLAKGESLRLLVRRRSLYVSIMSLDNAALEAYLKERG